MVVPGSLPISRLLLQLLMRDTSLVARSRMQKKAMSSIALLLIFVTLNDSRYISIEQNKRLNNSRERRIAKTRSRRKDSIGREG